jgi:endonuclease YncB( thermonuclease family)
MRNFILVIVLVLAGCNTASQTPVVIPQTTSELLSKLHGKSIDESYTVKRIGVTDGDTIKILDDRTEPPSEVKVRLESIDAPEKKQPFGTKAKQHLSELVFGQLVIVGETGKDRYGRTLAFIIVDGQDVCSAMVRDGFAWNYLDYSKSEALSAMQKEASDAKRGLWGGSEQPIAPWEWRKLD